MSDDASALMGYGINGWLRAAANIIVRRRAKSMIKVFPRIPSLCVSQASLLVARRKLCYGYVDVAAEGWEENSGERIGIGSCSKICSTIADYR